MASGVCPHEAGSERFRLSSCAVKKAREKKNMSKRREKTPKEFLGVPRCTNLQPLWSGVLTLMRPCFPNSSSGKTWCDPFVSHSANRAPVYHAHVSLTRGFEIKSSQVKSSQVKSAPTPAGEPNVRAEAEKRKNICTPKNAKPCTTYKHPSENVEEIIT